MAQAKTWAAFDVHVSGVVAATLDRESGELRVQRLPGRSEDVAAFAIASGIQLPLALAESGRNVSHSPSHRHSADRRGS